MMRAKSSVAFSSLLELRRARAYCPPRPLYIGSSYSGSGRIFLGFKFSSYITPATKLVYTPTNSVEFDTTSNVGGSASETKRRIAGDSQVCLNKGDVITTSNNSGSAVVVGTHVDPDTGAYVLDVVNVIGTIANGQSFTGSVSGATGTVVSLTSQSNLVTNKNGDINLLFNIPNTDAVRFRTGGKEFKLIDSATSTGTWTSRGAVLEIPP